MQVELALQASDAKIQLIADCCEGNAMNAMQ
jgi:hypothetical protein